MKTVLELFFVSYISDDDGFHWLRKEIDISQERQNPDLVATEYLDFFFSDKRAITEKERYILHSTSWRYEPPRTICLTYLVFAETFDFSHLSPGFFKVKDLEPISTDDPKMPRPIGRITPVHVLAHGIRHLAFLVVNDKKRIFDKVISSETRRKFEEMHCILAGEIY